MDEQTLKEYLQAQLNRDVVCEKITSTVNSRFASFKVIAVCNDVSEMYNPEIWPVGAYVRRFYEQRSRTGVNGVNGASVAGQVNGASAAHGTDAS